MAMPIMIQGTMSNAGKSVVTAALCRIFKKKGFSCAPFKSQNMALNSYVTQDGLEMGRAQAVQAEAAGIKPSVLMNPILLKPTNDTGSQVILNGEVIGDMTAREYYKNKTKFIPEIMAAYSALSGKYDIIVIEGAGSPAEINLKDYDIVNMGLAKLVKAPVLLVGDIDRGGVFAQLIGTVNLLDGDEKYIKGFIINKFRGDKEILNPGLETLKERSGKPVIGVIPYGDFDIDDEDGLSERFYRREKGGAADVAVIKFPRISNFTDFNIFERFDEVNLYYVKKAEEIKDPDMIILPGTKNTAGDLLWFRESGIEAKVKQSAAKGKVIFGICGGFQMLGEEIYENFGGSGKRFSGAGLLPIKTNFMKEKVRAEVKGKFSNIAGTLKGLSGMEFKGYEIHMGVSEIKGNLKNMNILYSDNFYGQKADGANVGNIYGTYVHGIFDGEGIAEKIISAIMKEKGIYKNVKTFNRKKYKEQQYDLLAETVEKNIDIDFIFKILKEGV